MHLFAVLLVWLVANVLRGADTQERLLAEQRITNDHLRKIRKQAAWSRIRAQFFAEHGLTIEEYAGRCGLPLDWIKSWSREVNAAAH